MNDLFSEDFTIKTHLLCHALSSASSIITFLSLVLLRFLLKLNENTLSYFLMSSTFSLSPRIALSLPTRLNNKLSAFAVWKTLMQMSIADAFAHKLA